MKFQIFRFKTSIFRYFRWTIFVFIGIFLFQYGGFTPMLQAHSILRDPDNNKVYAEFTPTLAVDGAKNILTAWQDSRPSSDHALLIQKMNTEGISAWPRNKSLNIPVGKIRFLSLDTDRDNNIFIAWVDQSVNNSSQSYLYLQKLNPQGQTLWQDPLVVATVKSVNPSFELISISQVRVDNNGNAYFVWLKKDNVNGDVQLFFQLVNSGRYVLYAEGKLLARDSDAVIPEGYAVDFELNKKEAVGYVSWVEQLAQSKEKRINLHKVNYYGQYQWLAPYRFTLGATSDLVQHAGIALDANENIFLGYLTTLEQSRHQLTLNMKRMNRFGQPLWAYAHTVFIDPDRVLGRVALAVDDNSKIFFLFDTLDELVIKAYHPDLNPSESTQYSQHSQTVLAKQIVTEGTVLQAHTGLGSLAQSSSNQIVVGWNQYFGNFAKPQNALVLQSTSGEHVFATLYRSDFLRALSATQMDTQNIDAVGRYVADSPRVNPSPPPAGNAAPLVVFPIDSDADGLSDADETQVYLTDPWNPDTDGDGYHDGDEVAHHYNPLGICRVKLFSQDGKIHVYGRSRLADLSDEQCRAAYLRRELQRILSPLKWKGMGISWQKYMNAFIYGDYPMKAIVADINGLHRAVHVEIPWQAWSQTDDYKGLGL